MKRKGQQLPNSPGIPGGYGKSKCYKNCCYCEKAIPIKEVTREHIVGNYIPVGTK